MHKLFLIFTFIGIVLSNDQIDFESMSDIQKFKFIRKEVLNARREGVSSAQKAKDQDPLLMETCIGDCQNVVNFSKDVTKILQNLDETKDPRSYAALKVGELVALNEFIVYVDEQGNRRCVSGHNTTLTEEFRDYDEEDLQLLFATDVELSEFRGAQLYNGVMKNTYFLRGQGVNADKVIKVSIEVNRKPKIELYEISKFDPESVRFTYKSDEKNSLLKTGKKADGVLDYAFHFDENSETGFSGSIGPRITYESEYNLPKKITLIEVNGVHDLTEEIKVKSKIEISDRNQEAQMTLTNKDNQTLSIIELDKHGDISIGIPYELRAQGSNFAVTGNTLIGTDKRKISASVAYDGENFLDASIEKGSSGSVFEVGKTYELEKGNSFIAVKFQKKSGTKSSNNTYTFDNDTNTNSDDKVFYISYSRRF